MKICTFFGHHSFYCDISDMLTKVLIDLIENHSVSVFYVGNEGKFDALVRSTLKELKANYPITNYIVLAYMPKKHGEFDLTDYSDTILADGLENVPPRFAISHRNRWMIEKSDYVVTYVTNHIASGAAQFKALAEKKGKTVINIE